MAAICAVVAHTDSATKQKTEVPGDILDFNGLLCRECLPLGSERGRNLVGPSPQYIGVQIKKYTASVGQVMIE